MSFLNPIPPAEKRVKIIYWLLGWARENGHIVWCDENLIRVAEQGDPYTKRTYSWGHAEAIAKRQISKFNRENPVKSTPTKEPRKRHRGEKPVVYQRVAQPYHASNVKTLSATKAKSQSRRTQERKFYMEDYELDSQVAFVEEVIE